MLYKGTAQDIPAGIKLVAVTVSASSASGTSSADDDVVGGKIIGYAPTGNQDQFVDNIEISSTGVVTVTLAANATANNTFNVAIARKTGNDA